MRIGKAERSNPVGTVPCNQKNEMPAEQYLAGKDKEYRSTSFLKKSMSMMDAVPCPQQHFRKSFVKRWKQLQYCFHLL